MSMNQYMHPRNIYKSPPNFKQLAVEYPEFRKYVKQDVTGKVTMDFKDVESVRALSCTLLKKDFDLNVAMPANKLIPTIPLRLNYLLWIEDLLSIAGESQSIKGIDVGTGASCVYSLIAAKNYKWSMLATEIDQESIRYAEENVYLNSLQELIKIQHIKGDTLLKEAIGDDDTSVTYDFCMCNPPFFSSSQELHPFFKARKESRPRPRNGFCASISEVVAKGGEIDFVGKLIQESKDLGVQVKIYTSMIGQKSSLSPLKKQLRDIDVVSFKQTEFCQGFTTRWGLAWTFCDIDLRKVPLCTLTASRKQKQKPLVYVIPQGELNKASIRDVAEKLKEMFASLQIDYEEMKNSKNVFGFVITAHSNTWSHQRRKRREQNRLHVLLGDGNESVKSLDLLVKSDAAAPSSPEMQNTSNMLAEMRVNSPDSCGHSKRALDSADYDEYYRCKKMKSSVEDCNCNLSSFYLKSTLVIRLENSAVSIEMLWIEGTANKDVLHQVLQYIKNNLKFN